MLRSGSAAGSIKIKCRSVDGYFFVLKNKKHIPKNVQMSATTYFPGQLPAKYFRHS